MLLLNMVWFLWRLTMLFSMNFHFLFGIDFYFPVCTPVTFWFSCGQHLCPVLSPTAFGFSLLMLSGCKRGARAQSLLEAQDFSLLPIEATFCRSGAEALTAATQEQTVHHWQNWARVLIPTQSRGPALLVASAHGDSTKGFISHWKTIEENKLFMLFKI